MFFISKAAVILTMGAALAVGGCKSATSRHSHDSMAANAVECDKCKVVYTTAPVTTGNPRDLRVIADKTSSAHECPDCADAAKSYFQAGRTQAVGTTVHTCTKCGGEMKTCHTMG